MKKLLSILSVLVILCGILVLPAAAAGKGNVSIGSASGAWGDTVTLSVNLNGNPGLVTMTVKVSYDASALQLTNVANSGLLVGAQLNTNYSSPYIISWVDGATTTNNTKTGTIATFTFKILDTAKIGDSTISLQFVDSYDTDYNENSFSATSGKVTVTCKHSYGSWTKVNDTTHKRTCSSCTKDETVNHTWDSGRVTRQPSCKETGEKTYTCTACSATKIETIAKTTNHKYGSWTKVNDTTHKHICSVCAKEETANHVWNSGAQTKKATCKEEGVKTYTCTICNTVKVEPIAKLTVHTYDYACDTDCNVCGITRNTTHNYKAFWSNDKNSHWHECLACKDRKNIAAHTPGAEATETMAQTCTTCGYVMKAALGHKHNYATTWTTDDAGHWHACSGCEEKGSYAAHDFENACDKDCSICGFSRETEHKFAESWTTDANNHWHVCSGCGLKQDEAAHEPGAEATATTAQTCTICSYEVAPALGIEETTEPSDAADTTPPTAPIDRNVSAENDATSPAATSIDQNVSDDNGFPVWIVMAIAAVGGIAALVVIKKKKP